MDTGGLEMQGARLSAAMVLTQLDQNILVSTYEALQKNQLN